MLEEYRKEIVTIAEYVHLEHGTNFEEAVESLDYYIYKSDFTQPPLLFSVLALSNYAVPAIEQVGPLDHYDKAEDVLYAAVYNAMVIDIKNIVIQISEGS